MSPCKPVHQLATHRGTGRDEHIGNPLLGTLQCYETLRPSSVRRPLGFRRTCKCHPHHGRKKELQQRCVQLEQVQANGGDAQVVEGSLPCAWVRASQLKPESFRASHASLRVSRDHGGDRSLGRAPIYPTIWIQSELIGQAFEY